MAAGKTTVGREVARRLGWSFLDMDHRIEERLGLAIREVFERQGEAAFREEERRLAEEIQRLADHVVAAGGGAFAFPETRDLLRDGALTVWLRCDLATVLARITPETGIRPLARSRETIRELFAAREPCYRLADLTVDAGGTLEEVTEQVVGIVRGEARPPGTT
jgi:shikimate kinase/3-dehydroquinate synthase